MLETRLVAVCPRCMRDWVPGSIPACQEAEHREAHRTFDLHLHRSEVVLPDGTSVRPVSFYPGDPYGRDTAADYGLYLDHRWQPPWPYQFLDWPDLGVPADPAAVQVALADLVQRARSGQRVEIGCWGGHGRTGTALAGLVALSGLPATEAVAWVRANYCDRAVETEAQAEFVLCLAEP